MNNYRSAYSVRNACVLLQVDVHRQCCVEPEVCVNDTQRCH